MKDIKKEFGISPAVGLILLIGITAGVSAIAGIVFLDIGNGLTQSVEAGVDISETPEGVEVKWNQQGNADEIKVTVDGGDVTTLSDVNDTVTLGVEKEKTVSAVGVTKDGASEVVKSKSTETDTVNGSTETGYTVKDSNIKSKTVTGFINLNPPIQGAKVTVTKPNGTVIGSTTTDSDGYYSVTGEENMKLNVSVEGDVSYNGNSVYASAKRTIGPSLSVTIDFDQTKLVDIGNGKSVVANNTISTIEDLQGIPDNSSEEFLLLNDIDASKTSEWNSGSGFKPIVGFSGVLDGDGHTISNLSINRSSTYGIGLFGAMSGTVQNLSVENSSISGRGRVGTIAGSVESSGVIKKSQVKDSTVESADTFVSIGGVAGDNDGTIELVSSINNTTLTGSYSGGVVGENAGLVTKSYSLDVSIPDDGKSGNLVGDTATSSTIKNSYARNSNQQALVGVSGGSIETSYTNSNSLGFETNSPVTNGYYQRTDERTENGGVQLGSYQMVGTGTSSYMSGFDFDTVWKQPEGKRYPVLQDNPEPSQQSEISVNSTLYGCKDVSYSTNGSGEFEIDSAMKLQCMDSKSGDSDFTLTSNIDVSSISNFYPVKNKGVFTGSLDGNGYTVSNLNISREGLRKVGLFSTLEGTVTNISFNNSNISSDESAGTVTGQARSPSTVENVHVSNSTLYTATKFTESGGLIGVNTGGSVARSSVVDTTLQGSDWSGGLIGDHQGSGTVSESYTRNITLPNEDRSASLVARTRSSDPSITKSYSTASDGSLVGENYDGTIDKSYVTANGFKPSGSAATVTDSYYDSSKISSSTGTGLTTSEMQGSAASSNMSAFDFSSTWNTITSNYPELQNNPE